MGIITVHAGYMPSHNFKRRHQSPKGTLPCLHTSRLDEIMPCQAQLVDPM